MLKYYQWVPMILLVMSFFFLLPRFMYRCLSKNSGIDLLNLADAAINYMSVEKFDKRRRILLYLANSIHFYSVSNKAKRTKGGFGNLSSNIGSPITGQSSSKPYLYNMLCCHGKFNGAYLISLFLLTKIFYIINSFAQLFILNLFLGFNYNQNGFHVLRDITKGLMSNTNALSAQRRQEAEAAAEQFASNLNLKGPQPILGPTVIFDTSDSDSIYGSAAGGGSSIPNGRGFGANANIFSDSLFTEPGTHTMMHRYFPRESACDFRIRANIDSLVHNYTVQCVLPINLYNEQLFTLLWAWLWLVCIANCYDLVVWIFRLLPGSRFNYVRSRLRLKNSENSTKRTMSGFVYDYLTFDGVFILRIMSLSMSDCVTHEIIQTLWQNYTETIAIKGNTGKSSNTGNTQSGVREAAYKQKYSTRRNDNEADNDYHDHSENI
jgi:hypothetical protein